MRTSNDRPGLRDETNEGVRGAPKRERYSATAETGVRSALGLIGAVLDAGEHLAAADLLEELPDVADAGEYGPRYGELDAHVRTHVSYETYVSPGFLRLARARNMTAMQWASVQMLMLQGAPLSDLDGFEPVGEMDIATGSLTLMDAEIEALPPGMHIDSLSLSNLPRMATVPDRLHVMEMRMVNCPLFVGSPAFLAQEPQMRRITVRNCALFDGLPERLSIRGVFELENCPSVKRIPGGEVRGEMRVKACDALEEVAADLQGSAEEVRFLNCGRLKHLLAVPTRDFLVVDGCPIEMWPENMQLRVFWLKNSPVKQLPRGLVVSDLAISGCDDLRSLPDDLLVTSVLSCPKHLRPDVERLQAAGRVPSVVSYV